MQNTTAIILIIFGLIFGFYHFPTKGEKTDLQKTTVAMEVYKERLQEAKSY